MTAQFGFSPVENKNKELITGPLGMNKELITGPLGMNKGKILHFIF